MQKKTRCYLGNNRYYTKQQKSNPSARAELSASLASRSWFAWQGALNFCGYVYTTDPKKDTKCYRQPEYRDMGKKYKGENVRPPAYRSPYPVSRLAPAIELVELARELGEADDMLTVQATVQLRLLAEQMEQLRTKARKILAETRENQELHRAECGFTRKPGQSYHLYRKRSGTLLFSLVGPSEWGAGAPFEYVGTYRLELDMTWKKLKG